MSKRSLKASEKGIEKAKEALQHKFNDNQTILLDDLNDINKELADDLNDETLKEQVKKEGFSISRSTLSNFFNYKNVDRLKFQVICSRLGLKWNEICDPPLEEQKSNNNLSEINALVQDIRQKVHKSIEETCGTMRILDMTQPIELGSIYTRVNVLDKITARRGYDINQLLIDTDPEDPDRFGWMSNTSKERLEGLKAVRNYCKLMVFGKPGSGKTTFLKYLAIQCNKGSQEKAEKLNNCVPIFIPLKQFAETKIEDKLQPGLLDYISYWLNECGVKEARTTAEQILKAGKAFVLLDGLDEVREEDSDRIIKEIRDFSQKFSSSQFIITCRIAAKDYTFDKFTEVEVADFGDEQIKKFAQSWFAVNSNNLDGGNYFNEFIQQLNNNNQIKELATNPLLLTFLCLEFEDSRSFPANRSGLYTRVTRTLLRKWDEKRGIKRKQVYGQLSLKRKEDLLSQVAFSTFNKKQYFFQRRVVEDRIADYIINLPNAPTDKEKLDIDSEAVLNSIEAQHGLLVERARDIYSFSHLTFQEYFTAQKIVREQKLVDLLEHITEKRWQEVFLLTSGMLKDTDELLRLMKQQVDELQPKDENIQKFFSWINRKANSLETRHKLAEVRVLYIGIGLLISFNLSPEFREDLSLYFSRYFSEYLNIYLNEYLYHREYLSKHFSFKLSFDLSQYLNLDFRYLYLGGHLDPNLHLSEELSFDLSQYLIEDEYLGRHLNPEFYLSRYLIRELDRFIPSVSISKFRYLQSLNVNNFNIIFHNYLR